MCSACFFTCTSHLRCRARSARECSYKQEGEKCSCVPLPLARKGTHGVSKEARRCCVPKAKARTATPPVKELGKEHFVLVLTYSYLPLSGVSKGVRAVHSLCASLKQEGDALLTKGGSACFFTCTYVRARTSKKVSPSVQKCSCVPKAKARTG